MGAVTKTLYETDFVEWTERTAALLRAGRFDEADIEHAAEEIEDLGRSERSAVASQLHRMLKHLAKKRIQPERDGTSWRRSITDGREEVEYRFDDSPSLRRYAEENLQKIYRRAVRDALAEAGLTAQRAALDLPAECPYSLTDLIEGESGPE
ncbi:MAG: DUF29 domain-containing protein [Bryobacteraceae bacterium]|jgi:Domain of unknown function DUF29